MSSIHSRNVEMPFHNREEEQKNETENETSKRNKKTKTKTSINSNGNNRCAPQKIPLSNKADWQAVVPHRSAWAARKAKQIRAGQELCALSENCKRDVMPAALLTQGVDRPCTKKMEDMPCNDPLVLALVKEVARHGQAVIAYVEGTFVTVCCAVTRAVLLVRDVACLPSRWLGHCWSIAFSWAAGNVGGGAVGNGEQHLLVNDDRPAVEGSDLRDLEEGVPLKLEQTPRTAPPSPVPARQQQQMHTLSGGNTCSITYNVVPGHEVSYVVPGTVYGPLPPRANK